MPEPKLTLERQLFPYSDGSGYRCSVRLEAGRPDSMDPETVTIESFGSTVTINLEQWFAIRDAVEHMIGWKEEAGVL